jgi:hypothetical protein
MTGTIGEKPKRKHKKKFKFVDNRGSFKTRKDFIETQYINGVRDESGNLVMRPLTEEEVAFLDRFYKESVHANFENSEETKKHELQIKALEREHKSYKKVFEEDSTEILKQIAEKKAETSALRKKLGNTYSDYDEQREIRQQNYQRNQCVFNKAKYHQKLDSFEEIVEKDWEEAVDETIIEDLITESEE